MRAGEGASLFSLSAGTAPARDAEFAMPPGMIWPADAAFARRKGR